MSSSPRAQPQRRLSTNLPGPMLLPGQNLNLHLGRTCDRTVEGSAPSIGRDELVRLGLAHAGDLERHRHRGEPVRLGGGPCALDRDVDPVIGTPDSFAYISIRVTPQ